MPEVRAGARRRGGGTRTAPYTCRTPPPAESWCSQPGGRLLTQWGTGGASSDCLWFPASVALDTQGKLWVDDMANGRVQSLGPDGNVHIRFGDAASRHRNGPRPAGKRLHRATTGLGTRVVVISKFSPSGTLLARWARLALAEPPGGRRRSQWGSPSCSGSFSTPLRKGST